MNCERHGATAKNVKFTLKRSNDVMEALTSQSCFNNITIMARETKESLPNGKDNSEKLDSFWFCGLLSLGMIGQIR